GQTYRAQAGNEHSMIAIDADLFQALVHSAESARNLRTIAVGEFIGQADEVFLLGHHILGHPSVALPSVGAAVFFAGTGDHVAAPAVIADAATRDVVDNHPVARFEASAARPHRGDLARGLMPGNHALV